MNKLERVLPELFLFNQNPFDIAIFLLIILRSSVYGSSLWRAQFPLLFDFHTTDVRAFGLMFSKRIPAIAEGTVPFRAKRCLV